MPDRSPARFALDAATPRLHPVARETMLAASCPPGLSFVPAGWGLPTALAGLLHARRRVGARILASAVEQEQVPARGTTVVPVDGLGRVEPGPWSDAVRSAGVAVAVLETANGEVGATQPLARARAGIVRRPSAVGLLGVREATRWALPRPRREAEYGRAQAGPWVPLALAAAEAWQQVAAIPGTRRRGRAGPHRPGPGDRGGIEDVDVPGDPVDRLPHVATFSALYLDGESAVHELDRRGFGVAPGSACTASVLEPSHVLAAMGALTHGNMRLVLPLPSVTPSLVPDAWAHRDGRRSRRAHRIRRRDRFRPTLRGGRARWPDGAGSRLDRPA